MRFSPGTPATASTAAPSPPIHDVDIESGTASQAAANSAQQVSANSSCSSSGSQLTLTGAPIPVILTPVTSPNSDAANSSSATPVLGSTASITHTPQTTSTSGATSFFKRYSGWVHGSSHAHTSTTNAQKSSAKDQVPDLIEVDKEGNEGVDETKNKDKESNSCASSVTSELTAVKQTKKGNATNNRRKMIVSSKAPQVSRPCQTHSFHTDAAEVQNMEKGLLKLMDDFNSGRLRAFGQGCSMAQMERIRDQQESLAKLHFELAARQELMTPLSEEALTSSKENTQRLMEHLERLSAEIGHLNPSALNDKPAEEEGKQRTTLEKQPEESEDVAER